MLHTARAMQALEQNVERFTSFDRAISDELAAYKGAFGRLSELDAAELARRLGPGTNGALPSEEWDDQRSGVLPCNIEHKHHAEARQWAAEALFDRTTFAADGSQVQPMPDISVPVAAVQIGWFENPHNPDAPYVKDVKVELLPPDEIFVERRGLSVFSDQAVSLRRFEREVDVLCDWMRERAGESPPPVVFFDGSLVVSFAEMLEDKVREFYIEHAVRLVQTSEECRIPLIGYVDDSKARDLVTMLGVAFADLGDNARNGRTLTDASLLHGEMKWGDRTPAWVCNRSGVLGDYYDRSKIGFWGDRICFVYLKTAGQNVPARLDVPRWVVETGLIEDVVGIVRAEAVVGAGYPYAIETADALAVITVEDRRRFYGLFERFAEEHNIRLRVASKMQSKVRRR